MRKFKWALLVVTGGVLLQLSGCATTALGYLAEIVLQQLLRQALSTATA